MEELNKYKDILQDFISHIRFGTETKYSLKEYFNAIENISILSFSEYRKQAEYYSKLINIMATFIIENNLDYFDIPENVNTEDYVKEIIAYFKNQMNMEEE